MCNGKIFIHVGLRRTGTSFLQQKIFSKLDGINYIDKHKLPLTYLRIDNNKTNLISYEGLSGKPYDIIDAKDTRFEIADTLKQLFPGAKIIIGIRETEDWLKSCYAESIKAGNYLLYPKWFERTIPSYTDNTTYIDYLKRTFDDVLVYEFEEFRDHTERVVEQLCKYIGANVPEYVNVKVNVRYTKKQMGFVRFLNRFQKTRRYNPNGLISHYHLKNLLVKIQEKVKT